MLQVLDEVGRPMIRGHLHKFFMAGEGRLEVGSGGCLRSFRTLRDNPPEGGRSKWLSVADTGLYEPA